MLEKVIKKNHLSIKRSLAKFNYDEPDKMYVAFHTTKSVNAMLDEEELEILINELQEAKKVLQESNNKKNLKGTKFKVLLEHKKYKCTAYLLKDFYSEEEAKEEIKKHNNNDYNYYIMKG